MIGWHGPAIRQNSTMRFTPQFLEELVGMLRATEEWQYVEREVDIRVERERLDAG